MTRRILPLLLAGAVVVAGLAVAQDPAGQDEPPVRLKKKGKPNGDDKPKTEPAKPGEEKKKEPAKEEPGAAEESVPEVIDEHEVLDRVARTMRTVEEKLGKQDLGEGTRQGIRDVIKDLDSLIANSQRPNDQQQNQQQQNQQNQDQQNQEQNQGGGEKNQEKNSKGSQGSQNQNKGGGQGKQGSQSQGGGGGMGKQGSQNQPGGGRQARRERRMQQARAQRSGRGGPQQARGNPMGGEDQGNEKPQQKPGTTGGNQGGGGANQSPLGPNRNADLYKDVWGHLPESLRAEMNAYSNPEPFLAKYDELIRKYYRTIAEQGRKKGD